MNEYSRVWRGMMRPLTASPLPVLQAVQWRAVVDF